MGDSNGHQSSSHAAPPTPKGRLGVALRGICDQAPVRQPRGAPDVKRERKSPQTFTQKYAPNLDIVAVFVKLDNHRAVKC